MTDVTKNNDTLFIHLLVKKETGTIKCEPSEPIFMKIDTHSGVCVHTQTHIHTTQKAIEYLSLFSHW